MMNRVTQYRIQAGWSPNELSSIFKVPAGIVNKWEHGELEPPAWIEERIRAKMMEEQKKRFSKKKRRPNPLTSGDPTRRWRP